MLFIMSQHFARYDFDNDITAQAYVHTYTAAS